MARDLIQKANYLAELIQQVTVLPGIFVSKKDDISVMFDKMIAFRDDEDTPTEYVTLLQGKINGAKTALTNMINSK